MLLGLKKVLNGVRLLDPEGSAAKVLIRIQPSVYVTNPKQDPDPSVPKAVVSRLSLYLRELQQM